MKAEFFCSA